MLMHWGPLGPIVVLILVVLIIYYFVRLVRAIIEMASIRCAQRASHFRFHSVDTSPADPGCGNHDSDHLAPP